MSKQNEGGSFLDEIANHTMVVTEKMAREADDKATQEKEAAEARWAAGGAKREQQRVDQVARDLLEFEEKKAELLLQGIGQGAELQGWKDLAKLAISAHQGL